jgi:hypothetical protein
MLKAISHQLSQPANAANLILKKCISNIINDCQAMQEARGVLQASESDVHSKFQVDNVHTVHSAMSISASRGTAQ